MYQIKKYSKYLVWSRSGEVGTPTCCWWAVNENTLEKQDSNMYKRAMKNSSNP